MSVPKLVVVSLLVTCALAGAACGGNPKQAKDDPSKQSAAYLARLAQSQFRAGRVTEALSLLDQAIQKEPRNAVLQGFAGQICFVAGRFPEAERRLLETLALDPGQSDARNYLGAVYSETGRKDMAEAEFKRVLQDPVYPTPEKAWLNLGALYASQGRQAEAVRAMRRSVELNPKYYEAHYQLAGLLETEGRLEEAAREYEVAAPEFRNQGEFLYRLGMTYFRLGRPEKARESLTRVLAVAPGSTSAEQAEELLKMLR